MRPAYVALSIITLAAVGAAVAYRRAAGFDNAAAPESADDDGSSWTEPIARALQGSPDRAQDMSNIATTDSNVRAFLEAIARAEGTTQRSDPYRVCFAYRHTIRSFSDHPAILGEWKGEPLPDNQCRAAGFSPGCVSTAAGKYQITRSTWRKLKARLALPDFSPASQDAAAVELLRESGALEHAQAGRFELAVARARRIWASLPGAGYEQPERSLAWLADQYVDAGGRLA